MDMSYVLIERLFRCRRSGQLLETRRIWAERDAAEDAFDNLDGFT